MQIRDRITLTEIGTASRSDKESTVCLGKGNLILVGVARLSLSPLEVFEHIMNPLKQPLRSLSLVRNCNADAISLRETYCQRSRKAIRCNMYLACLWDNVASSQVVVKLC